GFLDALYQDSLGRAVDAGARAAWDQALATGVTRTQVAALVLGSTEYKTDLVSSFYTSLLRRPADGVGLNALVAQLLAGVSDAQVVAELVSSDEYFGSTVPALLPPDRNAQFVAQVFKDVLGPSRPFNPGGQPIVDMINNAETHGVSPVQARTTAALNVT